MKTIYKFGDAYLVLPPVEGPYLSYFNSLKENVEISFSDNDDLLTYVLMAQVINGKLFTFAEFIKLAKLKPPFDPPVLDSQLSLPVGYLLTLQSGRDHFLPQAISIEKRDKILECVWSSEREYAYVPYKPTRNANAFDLTFNDFVLRGRGGRGALDGLLMEFTRVSRYVTTTASGNRTWRSALNALITEIHTEEERLGMTPSILELPGGAMSPRDEGENIPF